jgi:hypothetical protein
MTVNMTNRIDFFQSAQTQLALPAAGALVLVDGTICSQLKVVEIVRAAWPEFSWARLAGQASLETASSGNPATEQNYNLLSIEQLETKFASGQSICIRQCYNGNPPNSATFSIPIFAGQIETIDTKVGPDGEKVEIIARDFGAQLRRLTVYGQRVIKSDGSTVFLSGLDTIFNADGKANASSSPIQFNGKSYTVFCYETSQNKFWSCAEIIDYLLCQSLPINSLHRPDIYQLRKLTENQTLRDFDVTGLNLLDALHRCCEQVGLKFKFVPRLTTGPTQAIVFYNSKTERTVELNIQKTGHQISIWKTDIAALQNKRNFYPVTHKYIGQGDFKVYEAAFELVKAWDPTLENTNYYNFCPSSNPDFYKVKDVYRKWCLNEAGSYSGPPYNQGPIFDFTKIFGNSNFAHRPRRFWPCLTTDKQGKSLGYFLQVSYDGVHWWLYMDAFNMLLDECGIWLSSNELDINTWVAALKGVLRFRITASVISDERLTCAVADGPVDSSIPVIEHVITMPRRFKLRKVSKQSIFAEASDETFGEPDQIDDTDALYEFVRQTAATQTLTFQTVNVQTPSLVLDYRVGDKVTSSPESRDLLSCLSDNRSTYRIHRVRMDFVNQSTNLGIVRQRSG